MFRVCVCYGEPTDPAAFDAHYTDVHVPLARKIPGLRGFTTGKCQSVTGGEPTYYMVASLDFDNAESMTAALASAEMAAASADVANFATGGATIYGAEEIDRL
jgi:uncharacterized protein (TIGR02118 family)